VRYLLDTNIIIHAHDGLAAVLDNLAAHAAEVATSTLCLAELRRGLHRRPELVAERRLRLDRLISQMPVLAFDTKAVEAYDRIIAQCGFVRARDFDRMIAAHSLSVGAVLVTDNRDDFADIPELAVENWTMP
jgi:tRNA(fMet)-specific endonuclease VapC